MKFTVDAHLPVALTAIFSGHDVVHTSSLPEGNNTPDAVINKLSIKEERALITKDNDFYYSFLSTRKPYWSN